MGSGMLESSYHPALYSPESHHTWEAAGAAAGPKPLAWKLASSPSPSSPQRINSIPAARHADAQSTLATAGGRSTVPAHSKYSTTGAPAAAAAAGSSAPSTSTVLGSGIAGYTSVITKSPISPSGYAVPARPSQGAQLQQQHAACNQQCVASPGSSRHLHSVLQQTATSISYNSSSTRLSQPMPSSSGGSHVPSSAGSSTTGGPAAAAAAALAALSGSSGRINSASSAGSPSAAAATGAGSYVQQYSANKYSPPVSAGSNSSSSSSRGSMLLWNVKQAPPGAGATAAPLVGRRAATASSTAGQLSSSSSTVGSYTPTQPHTGTASSSSSYSRPCSQESSSPGLMKLKQLSTARLARRLGTPPAAAGHGSACAGRQEGGCPPQHGIAGAQNSAGQLQPAFTAQYQQGADSSLATIGGSNDSSMHNSSQGQRGKPGVARPSAVPSLSSSSSSKSISTSSHPVADSSTKAISSYVPGRPQQVLKQATGPEYQEIVRQPCPSCGRCFAPAALQQHMRICDKVFNQKRKVFDVKSQRLAGTGAATPTARQRTNSAGKGQHTLQRGCGSHDKRSATSAAQAKKSKWQLQSEQLRAAMRAVRPGGGSGPDGWSGAAAQVEEVKDTRVPCPHCGRRFAELVAERHIPKCADIIAKPSRLKAAGGRAAYMRSNSRGSR